MNGGDIVRRYMDRGLRGDGLRSAVGRHARILAAMDPDVSEELMTARLRQRSKPPPPPPSPARIVTRAESEWE